MANYNNLSDRELTDLLRRNDQGAFTEIYHRYKWVLYLHAVKRIGNREEARDIVQELFTTLWDKRGELDLTTYLSGYLYTSVRNRIIKLISHQQVVLSYVDSIRRTIAQTDCITDHKARENSLAEVIEKEINELPEKMREIFIMSRKRHMSHKEIANELGIAESTVKRQVSNALHILRKKLGLFTWLLFLIIY
jgi:RNA polymerase sigma-70 factor (ECF subfamily)